MKSFFAKFLEVVMIWTNLVALNYWWKLYNPWMPEIQKWKCWRAYQLFVEVFKSVIKTLNDGWSLFRVSHKDALLTIDCIDLLTILAKGQCFQHMETSQLIKINWLVSVDENDSLKCVNFFKKIVLRSTVFIMDSEQIFCFCWTSFQDWIIIYVIFFLKVNMERQLVGKKMALLGWKQQRCQRKVQRKLMWMPLV